MKRILLLVLLAAQIAYPQQAPPALSLENVTENLILPEALQQQRIKERRVNFELTDAQAAALKKKGASDAVIRLIRDNLALPPGIVQISCKPVDCLVVINEQPKGQTTNGVLRLELPAGPVGVEVRAPDFRPAVAVFVVELNKVKEKEFVLERLAAPTGVVALTCDAGAESSECEVRLDDRSFQATNQRSIQFTDLPAGPHRLAVRAKGFLDASRNVTVKGGATETLTVKLTPAPAVDPAPFLDDILAALGGESNLPRAQKLGARGTATIITDLDRRTTKANFVESVKLPFVRWDFLIDGQEWSSGTTATEAWSDGNSKFRNTPLAQQLPLAIQAFKTTRITDLIWFKNSIYAMRVVDDGGKQSLILESKEDRFTVTFQKSPMQATMVREAIGGTLRTELNYEKFSNVDGIMLPQRVTIRLPGYTQVMDYDGYFTNQQLYPREFFAEKKASFQKIVEITKEAEAALKGAPAPK